MSETYSYYPDYSSVVRDSDRIRVAPCQSVDDPDYAAYVAWVEEGNIPSPPPAEVPEEASSVLIITENIMCSLPEGDPRHVFFAFIPSELGDKVRVIENMPIEVNITIKDVLGNVVPITDNFALPITGEGMPTQLLFLQFSAGAATVHLNFPLTGLYEITQDTLNRELPPEAHFKFNGVKIYVLKLPNEG